jgi:hypothetical protein
MKLLIHFLKFYAQANSKLVVSYLIVVAFVVALELSLNSLWAILGLSGPMIIVLGVLALCLLLGLHSRAAMGRGDDFLQARPIGNRSLFCFQVLFLFLVIILPLAVWSVVILLSYDANFASYRIVVVWLILGGLQIALWNTVGSMMKSQSQTVLLLITIYLPVFAIYALAEAVDSRAMSGAAVIITLGSLGALSIGGMVKEIPSKVKIYALHFWFFGGFSARF